MAQDNRAAQSLRAFFEQTNTTQSQLSKLTGISQSQLSRLASGEKCLSDRKQGLALLEHAGIELPWWDQDPIQETKTPPGDHEAPTRKAV